jgi:hypothetical protein
MTEQTDAWRKPSGDTGGSRPNGPAAEREQFRSHLVPRTRDGWVAVLLFVGLFALVEPPFVHGWANRVEPWILGFPFLYTYLLVFYTALVIVLIWALRRRI